MKKRLISGVIAIILVTASLFYWVSFDAKAANVNVADKQATDGNTTIEEEPAVTGVATVTAAATDNRYVTMELIPHDPECKYIYEDYTVCANAESYTCVSPDYKKQQIFFLDGTV